ncbi:MAG: hypothetical protein HOI47_27060 [Candidatus Scalindua sp.]|mgnify:CR=1 FL=1|jgi:hypothetical protein|nr:hypothetical protein [Candidatus Scalindua sp.]MBT6230321.1 hypothetical protein [Candidatus Scalindua sp.]
MQKDNQIDYKEIFRHVEGLKIATIVIGAARSGSDFFQSLLDGHSQILQFTGHWSFESFWEKAVCKTNLSDLIDEFIWFSGSTRAHISKFKSQYDKMERWDRLGEGKNESFSVDIDLFKSHLSNLMKDREINSRNYFLAVNAAYGLACKINVMQTRLLLYHVHTYDKLEAFKKDFPCFTVICTTRDPRNVITSGMNHWGGYNAGKFSPITFYRLIKRTFRESEPILQYTREIRVLKLEDLHLMTNTVIEDFCSLFDLKKEASMFVSSFHGKLWWGDEVTPRFINGFNPNIKRKNWKENITQFENIWIEFLLATRLRHYRYDLETTGRGLLMMLLSFFLMHLPTKYEIRILSFRLSKEETYQSKLRLTLTVLKYYVQRIAFLYGCFIKRCRRKLYLPKYLGMQYHDIKQIAFLCITLFYGKAFLWLTG